jgi:hypothetical protein
LGTATSLERNPRDEFHPIGVMMTSRKIRSLVLSTGGWCQPEAVTTDSRHLTGMLQPQLHRWDLT